MDETDALDVRTDDDDNGVVNSSNTRADDDEAPTVEETYEVTTTRRKTVRTSYKIQEVSCQAIHDGHDYRNLRASVR